LEAALFIRPDFRLAAFAATTKALVEAINPAAAIDYFLLPGKERMAL